MRINDKKLIPIVILVILCLLVLNWVRCAFVFFNSEIYQVMTLKAEYFGESGYIKEFDASQLDVSYVDDIKKMSDKEFFYWVYDNWLTQEPNNTTLTIEQYIISKFVSPRMPKSEYNEIDDEKQQYEFALQYATEEDLEAYNQKYGTNFQSIEDVLYDNVGNKRHALICKVIENNEKVQEFAETHPTNEFTSFGLNFADTYCIEDILAHYHGITITEDDIENSANRMISETIDDNDSWFSRFNTKIVFGYLFKHQWKGLAARDALNMKYDPLMYELFSTNTDID